MQVGPDDHVICALSGGVDSAVAAVLVHKVLRERLHCVFVDNGLLRYKVRASSHGILPYAHPRRIGHPCGVSASL